MAIGEISGEIEALGTRVVIRRFGSGPRVLLLHGEDGFLFNGPLLERLGSRFSVIAPEHPGWGSVLPPHIRKLDDLSYLYLDLLDRLGQPHLVIGLSLGAWIAAEMATKDQRWMSGLALVAPLGIKVGGREDRSFFDLYASGPERVTSALYADVSRAPDLAGLSQAEFVSLATAQEAVARFGWEPYLHNPQLPARLARIRVPSLVVAPGLDGFVPEPGYYERYTALIGSNARLVVVPSAGHRVDEEDPAGVVAALDVFEKSIATERQI